MLWRSPAEADEHAVSGSYCLYRDLDPKNWPKDQSIAKHPLVRELFEGSKRTEVELSDEYPIDAPELQKDVPTS